MMPSKRITVCLQLVGIEPCGKPRKPGKTRCAMHQKLHDHEAWIRRPGIEHCGSGNYATNSSRVRSRASQDALLPKKDVTHAGYGPVRSSAFNRTGVVQPPANQNPVEPKAKRQLSEDERRAHQEREAARRDELLAKARVEALERGECVNNWLPAHIARGFEGRTGGGDGDSK